MTYYQNGIKIGSVRVGAGLRLYAGNVNQWVNSGFSTNEAVLDQVRIFNRALTEKEVKQINLELAEETSSPTNSIIANGHLYLSNGKRANNLYDNKAVVFNASISSTSNLSSKDYYIKATENNVIELVENRPTIGQKSTSGEYYLEGAWYSKTNEKLPRQTYLPYTVATSNNKFIKLNPIDIKPRLIVVSV